MSARSQAAQPLVNFAKANFVLPRLAKGYRALDDRLRRLI
jgi:hypothetical protein